MIEWREERNKLIEGEKKRERREGGRGETDDRESKRVSHCSQ